jgi:hypothetical protein
MCLLGRQKEVPLLSKRPLPKLKLPGAYSENRDRVSVSETWIFLFSKARRSRNPGDEQGVSMRNGQSEHIERC